MPLGEHVYGIRVVLGGGGALGEILDDFFEVLGIARLELRSVEWLLNVGFNLLFALRE
jgi:hypothetical protein